MWFFSRLTCELSYWQPSMIVPSFQILKTEVPAIKRAMENAGCNAKLTYVVVEKGHSIRLFRKEASYLLSDTTCL